MLGHYYKGVVVWSWTVGMVCTHVYICITLIHSLHHTTVCISMFGCVCIADWKQSFLVGPINRMVSLLRLQCYLTKENGLLSQKPTVTGADPGGSNGSMEPFDRPWTSLDKLLKQCISYTITYDKNLYNETLTFRSFYCNITGNSIILHLICNKRLYCL